MHFYILFIHIFIYEFIEHDTIINLWRCREKNQIIANNNTKNNVLDCVNLTWQLLVKKQKQKQNKIERADAANELTSGWPWPHKCITLWSRVLLSKFYLQTYLGCWIIAFCILISLFAYSQTNWLLVDSYVTFDPTNVLHSGQGFFWPNLTYTPTSVVEL